MIFILLYIIIITNNVYLGLFRTPILSIIVIIQYIIILTSVTRRSPGRCGTGAFPHPALRKLHRAAAWERARAGERKGERARRREEEREREREREREGRRERGSVTEGGRERERGGGKEGGREDMQGVTAATLVHVHAAVEVVVKNSA